MNDAERFSQYCAFCRQINGFFNRHIADYCRNCLQVLRRLPAGCEQYELVSGVFPGCCHRGAGDIFRLEGVDGESRLSAAIIALLQKARNDRVKSTEGFNPVYELKNCHTGERITGAHCRYFGARGCLLDELKGPLCINFICPPIREDLLKATNHDEDIVGPEHDFLGIYQLLSVLGIASAADWQRELFAFGRRLAALDKACEQCIAAGQGNSLFSTMSPV